MASMNVSIKQEAYDFLKMLKSKNESFSDVILKFKSDQKDILSFFGVLKDSDWKNKEKVMREFRTSFNKRLK